MKRVPGTYRKRRSSVLYVLPSIPDDASADLKNALAIRNSCVTEGRCPACGAVPDLDYNQQGIDLLTFRHEKTCPVLRDDGSTAA